MTRQWTTVTPPRRWVPVTPARPAPRHLTPACTEPACIAHRHAFTHTHLFAV